MSAARFVLGLLVITTFSFILFYLCDYLIPETKMRNIQVPTILLFTVFSTALYYLCDYAIRLQKEELFTQLSILSVLFKITLCVGFLLYNKEQEIIGTVYDLIPFLLSYILFTIYEVYYLSKIAYYKQEHH